MVKDIKPTGKVVRVTHDTIIQIQFMVKLKDEVPPIPIDDFNPMEVPLKDQPPAPDELPYIDSNRMTKLCLNCGLKIKIKDNFCEFCGNPQ